MSPRLGMPKPDVDPMNRQAIKSDWFWVEHLLGPHGNAPLSMTEIYRACAALANSGRSRPEELSLDESLKTLIEVRRMIFSCELKEAKRDLDAIKSEIPSLAHADTLFLQAIIAHRRGKLVEANATFEVSAGEYETLGETHRHLRALSNSAICKRDLGSHVSGELFQLERKAHQLGCYDVVGNIKKARTIELMMNAKFSAALTEAQDCVTAYGIDGCPEDRAVAHCLLSMNFRISGNLDAARKEFSRVVLNGGKVAGYKVACDALMQGRLPRFKKGHPLFGIRWPRAQIKTHSVQGKIMQRLQTGPVQRDELIKSVWGPRAIDPTYEARLHTAISDLRKSTPIAFDGECYKIE